MVLDQEVSTIRVPPHLRHVAFGGPLCRKGPDFVPERRCPREPIAIGPHLLPRPLGDDSFETLLAERGTCRADEVDREIAVAIGEDLVGQRRERPHDRRPTAAYGSRC